MGKATIGGRHRLKKKKVLKYVSLSQSLKYLHIPRSVFRHLCILKGIYPKEPRRRKSGKLSYLFRDIQLLRTDPIYHTYVKYDIWLTKLRKSTDKGNYSHQESLLKNKPLYNYDHLVKERYATFRSCLLDLGDCVTLLMMIRRFPRKYSVSGESIELADKYCREFLTYVRYSNSLTKVFVTTKGIYYEVVIEDVPIVFVMPFGGVGYEFKDSTRKSDYESDEGMEIFSSFVGFYLCVMKFVVFRLFTYGLRVKYPLDVTKRRDLVYDVEGFEKIDEVEMGTVVKIDTSGYINVSENDVNDLNLLLKKDDDTNELTQTFNTSYDTRKLIHDSKRNIFENKIFFISRECYTGALEFVILAYKGRITNILDENIDYLIIEREIITEQMKKFNLIHPQWVFDSVNLKLLLPLEKYIHGNEIPPHLSPFVQYNKDVYMPKYAKETQQMINNITRPDIIEDEEIEIDEEELEEMYNREMEDEKKGVIFNEHVKRVEKEKEEKNEKQLIKYGVSEKEKKKEEQYEQDIDFRKIILPSRKKYRINKIMEKRKRKKNKVRKLVKRRTLIEKNERIRKKNEVPNNQIKNVPVLNAVLSNNNYDDEFDVEEFKDEPSNKNVVFNIDKKKVVKRKRKGGDNRPKKKRKKK